MCIYKLVEVSARLEDAASALSDACDTPYERYEQYEMLAIQIQDSEFDDYPDGVLEYYLKGYLAAKKYELLGEDAFLNVTG